MSNKRQCYDKRGRRPGGILHNKNSCVACVIRIDAPVQREGYDTLDAGLHEIRQEARII